MLNVTLAPPQQHRSLTVFPLVAQDAPDLPYMLMSDALQHGVLRITEVGSGTVPELLAINVGELSILVLDGEQLVGARQNRTTNRSMLLAAKSETKIPVSCMEQGRWHFNTDQFAPTMANSPTTVRRHAREVEAGFAASGAAAPVEALSMAQGDVWNAIADHSSKLGTRSGTGALDHLYTTRADDLEAWAREYPLVPHQVGILAFQGARPLGMDLVGSDPLYARLHDRMLRGYVMDALASRARSSSVTVEAGQRFLDRVAKANRVEATTVGLGRYAVLAGAVIGGELRENGHMVHLSAFPAASSRGQGSGSEAYDQPISPPSRRRRRRE